MKEASIHFLRGINFFHLVFGALSERLSELMLSSFRSLSFTITMHCNSPIEFGVWLSSRENFSSKLDGIFFSLSAFLLKRLTFSLSHQLFRSMVRVSHFSGSFCSFCRFFSLFNFSDSYPSAATGRLGGLLFPFELFADVVANVPSKKALKQDRAQRF